jgi:hypothetical protein
VLVVDLVGSTALVTGADPDVSRRRVTRFFEACGVRLFGPRSLGQASALSLARISAPDLIYRRT